MKLSCALVLTLANLVIATPFSFSVKGSGASAKAEAATSTFGQFGVVKPVVPKTSGFSGSFSKSSSASFASSSASSSSSSFNYNAGQVGTASLGYGSQGLLVPHKNVEPQVVAVPQATAFATTGSNSQTGASVDVQADFSAHANVPANAQYQSVVPESKPNLSIGFNSQVPSHWHENSKPNSFNTNANVPVLSEKVKETSGVQSFSSNVESGTAFLPTTAAPSLGSASVENAPSYSGGFGGPPGILSPHDKIPSVGSTPGFNGFPSYPAGAQLNVPNKQQNVINTPVSTVNPSYVQHDYQAGNVNPTVPSINNEYVFHSENSQPSYKPEIKPSYLELNKPTVSSSSDAASNEWQHNDGHQVTLQPYAEISHAHKELEQAPPSISQFSLHSEKPLATNQDTKPVKNVQIFIQPVPSNAPHVHFTNTQVGSENKKEVKPTNQLLYVGGFGAPAGILKPSSQSLSSGQTFPSSPVKIEQHESSSVGLTGFGGSLSEVKEQAQPSWQSTNDHSFDSVSTSGNIVTPKPSSSSLFVSSEQVSNDFVSTEQKGIEQFSVKPSENSFQIPSISSWAQKPTVNSLPEFEVQKKPTSQNFFNTPLPSPHSPEQGLGEVSIAVDKSKPTTLPGTFGQVSADVKPTVQSTTTNDGFVYSSTPYKPVVTPNTPHFQATKEKESSFVAFTTTQQTPVNSWQQSTTTYKPSSEGSTPGYFSSHETYPTKYPSLTGDYTVPKKPEQYPSNVGSTPVDFQVSSNVNQQSSNYGSTAASFVAQEPAAQVNFASPTLTSFSQVSQLAESPKTSPPQSPPKGTFTVSKEVNKVPTQIVTSNVYLPGSVAPANFVGQAPVATSELVSVGIKQQQQPPVASSLTTSSLSGSYVSSNVSPTQKPIYTESFNVPKETEIIPSDTSSNVDSTVGSAPALNTNAFPGKPQTQFGVSQHSVVYKPTVSLVTKEPTASVNLASQTISSTSDLSQSTTFSQQSPNKPTDKNSGETNPVSGLPEIPKITPPKSPQHQLPTKPTVELGPQKQPVYSNVFGTNVPLNTGAVKPSSYPTPSPTGHQWSSSNSWSGPGYVTGYYDKPKQSIYFNQYKPAVSSFPEKKDTLIPSNPPYFTGSTNFASNIPTTPKPYVPVASLNVAQQSSPSITIQKEKEPTVTTTSGSGPAYSKPTSQPILSNSEVSYTSFSSPKPTKQISVANPTLASLSQDSSYKPTFENSLPASSVSQFPESPKTSPPQSPPTGTFTVTKEIYKVPTQILSSNIYIPSSIPAVNFVNQAPVATSELASAGIKQQQQPPVASSLTTSSLSGSYVSSNVSPTQKPIYTESSSIPKETEVVTPDTSSVVSTVGTAPTLNSNAFTGKPQTQFGVSQHSVVYKPTVSLVTKEPTASVNVASQTVSSTSATSSSTSFSQQSLSKPTVVSSGETSPVSGLPEIPKITPPKSPQQQLPTKPTAEIVPQKQPVHSNVFGTNVPVNTGAVKPSSYPFTSSSGYPWSSSNSWSGSGYVKPVSYDKPKQSIYFNQYKPAVSSFPEKKDTLIPSNPPYFTGSANFASNIPTTAKPFVAVSSLNVAQQSSSSVTNQKEKESPVTATSGSGTTYSKPTPQPALSSSGVSFTSFASPKPTKPTNQVSTSNSAFFTYGSSLSQVKPQYQFSTVQPVTQKNQWYTNNYGTFGAVKPHSYTYPGFTSSYTTFGQGSFGGLYDKTKQTTQYTSSGQYKPTSSGQYNPSLTGHYKPIATGQYKPTYNWGFAGQSQFQTPPNQPTQTGGSYVSTYTQTTSKPFVTLSSFNTLKPTSAVPVVSKKESSISSGFASSTTATKPTNQPSWIEKHESHQTSGTGVFSAPFVTKKPSSSETSFESVTGSPSLTNILDKGKVTSSVVSTTSKYDLQKPVNPTVQTVSNTYTTSSVISAKPTGEYHTTVTPLLENKPTSTYTVQQQVDPSVQTITPTKDVEKLELNQSIKPIWSSSNQKESSGTSYTEVATSNLDFPSSPSLVSTDNSHFVDKVQISQVKPTSTFDIVRETPSSVSTISINKEKPLDQLNGQVASKVPTSVPVAQTNPALQQSIKPFSIQSHSQVQPVPTKPEHPSNFGVSWVQSTPPKHISSSLESSTGQKESVQHFDKEYVVSKPIHTPFLSNSQAQTVVGLGSASTQFSKTPSSVYFDSKPDKVQYTSRNVQSGYKPSSVVGSTSSYGIQQNVNPSLVPLSQETYSNIAVSSQTKPPGQNWALNTQSPTQQTAFLATKPNVQITLVGKPSSTIVSPPYSGGFGGPSGILKPNEFGLLANQGNVQSQFQATSGAYSGVKVETDSNKASYSGGFGGPSGVLKPDEKHSVHHAGHDKPFFNGFHAGTRQDGVVPAFATPGVHVDKKEQTGFGAQVSSEVQGNAFTNVVASAAPNVVASAAPNVVASVAPNVVLSATPNVVASTVSNILPGATPNVVASVEPNVVPSATPNVVVSAAPNAAINSEATATANASGFAISNAYASGTGIGKTGTSFGGQFGAVNGFSANAKGSATASASSSSVGGSFTTFNPAGHLVGSPGNIARLLG